MSEVTAQRTDSTSTAPAPVAAPAPAPAVGSPAVVGVPMFVIGSVALGLADVGFVPAAAAGASIPIIMTATGIGLLVSAIWAANLAQNAVAAIFGIFAGFWLSYAALFLGLVHGWYGVAAADVAKTQELYLVSWMLLIGLLTLASLRLPLAFTLIFALITIALLLTLLGVANASSSTIKLAGYVVFAFAAIGAYLFYDAMNQACGGKPSPLGAPLVH